MRVRIAFFALLFPHSCAMADGYQNWKFGMTHAQIKAVSDPARYYTFSKGDIGAGVERFEDGEALLSFYFTQGQMERAMLTAYMGEDASLARIAWAGLTNTCLEFVAKLNRFMPVRERSAAKRY